MLFRAWLGRRPLGISGTHGPRPAPCRSPLAVERLEARSLPSSGPLVREVTVMSRNLDQGADLNPVVSALATGNPQVFVPAVSQMWAKVRATDFPQRAEALADEVLHARPVLVGLQEVALWRTGPAQDPAPATRVEYDFLQTLLGELAERGLHYAVATTNINWEAEVPAITHRGILEDLRLTDRDAILVRTDLPAPLFQVSNAQTGDFSNNLAVPLPSGPFIVQRGWTAVDAVVGGKAFRFVNTHLEPESTNPLVNSIQVAQARELLAGPGATSLPTIFVGDFNSRADGTGTATYGVLTGDGFTDAWSVTHPGEPGNTYGHAENLLNETVNLDRRLDLVLFRGDAAALGMDVVGEDLNDRLPSGLWPSDHAGVVASLRIHVPPRIESVVVNDGSAQRSMVTSLTITFDRQVTFGVGAFKLRRQNGTQVDARVNVSLVDGKTVAVLTFTGSGIVGGSLADGNYRLTVRSDLVHDALGRALDGDDDGTAGGDRSDAIFRLYGDSDGDRDVDLHDLGRFLSSAGRRAGDSKYLAYFDVDGDDRVSLTDLFAFVGRLGTHLNH